MSKLKTMPEKVLRMRIMQETIERGLFTRHTTLNLRDSTVFSNVSDTRVAKVVNALVAEGQLKDTRLKDTYQPTNDTRPLLAFCDELTEAMVVSEIMDRQEALESGAGYWLRALTDVKKGLIESCQEQELLTYLNSKISDEFKVTQLLKGESVYNGSDKIKKIQTKLDELSTLLTSVQ